jgi:TatD DNase family protein
MTDAQIPKTCFPPIIDIAANLSHDCFDADFEAVLQNGLAVGVQKYLVVGTDIESSEKSLLLSGKYPAQFWCTAGMHPHHASDWSAEAAQRFSACMAQSKCIAAGEMGLDYFRNFSSPEDQRTAFTAQLALAVEHGLPAYLHVRDAHADFYPILKEFMPDLKNAVVHCFTGLQPEMEAYVELGCGIGITGWVCDERRGLDLQKIVPYIPDDRLMIETDCPYLMPRTLSPKPKSRRNEPMYLPEVLRVIAELRQQSPTEVAELTWHNSHRFFGFV